MTEKKTAAKRTSKASAAEERPEVTKSAAPKPSPRKAAASRAAGETVAAPASPQRRAAKAKAVVEAEGGHPPGGMPGKPGRGAKATAGAAKPARASGNAKGPTKAAKPQAKPKTLKNSRYSKAEADALFQRLADALPEPQTELEYTNPFTLLVAVALSAQATDVGVNRATRTLFEVADTPQKMADLGEERLRDYIKTIGLFNTKAKNVIALSQALVAEHGGEVPRERAALQALPGVGRKTANVVLNVAFGEPTIAVDTHIFRIGNRLGLAPGKTPDDVEKQLEKIVPERYLRGAHHWLILHGRHVCKARRPLCEACVIYELCKAPDRLDLPHA